MVGGQETSSGESCCLERESEVWLETNSNLPTLAPGQEKKPPSTATMETSQEYQLQQARQRLWQILLDSNIGKELRREASEIFQKFPSLATDSIGPPRPASPLVHFLLAGAEINIVQDVFDIDPKAISTWVDCPARLPLHIAIGTCSADVIIFLAKQYPRAVSLRESMNSERLPLPINEFLRKAIHDGRFSSTDIIEVLKTFLDIYPESIQIEDIHHETPVTKAIVYGYPNEVIDFLLGKFPDTATSCTISNGNRQFFPFFDQVVVNNLEKLLPRLTHLQCGYRRWDDVAFLHFLVALWDNYSVTDFHLTLPDLHGQYAYGLEGLLKYNRTIIRMTLTAAETPPEGINDAIVRGLEKNHTLEHLGLDGPFQMAWNELVRFIENAPQCLLLQEHARKWKYWPLNVDVNPDVDIVTKRHSRLTDLRVRNCHFPISFFKALLSNLALLPSLKRLTLDYVEKEKDGSNSRLHHIRNSDFTTAIVPIVEGSSLESLILKRVFVSIPRLCQVLKYNVSLKWLCIDAWNPVFEMQCLTKVLENNNTTLLYVDFHTPSSNGQHRYRRIRGQPQLLRYYTLMNRFGRKKIRSPNGTSKVDFVRLLSAANDHVVDEGPGSFDITILLFGMLRELPGLWSYNTYRPSRKRKREC